MKTNGPFDLTEYPLPPGTIVEASAGTGKTYSVAAHVTLAIATDDRLRIGQVLVTTYTRNAAAELRDRIRGRIVAAARLLRATEPEARDALDEKLLAVDPDERRGRAGRLERAVAEFDTATIGTIHSICGRVLRMAGLEPTAAGDEDLVERTVSEAVNDAVVAEAAVGRAWDERSLVELVTAALRDPFIVPWFDPDGRSEPERQTLARAAALVAACVERVRTAMRATPSFDDLLRLAWEEVRRPDRAGLVAEVRRRFRLAIVDEAQDTSRLQWEFFHAIFPPLPPGSEDDGRRLIAVGDPKQAIYGFRGADVTAYLRFTAGDGRGPRPRRTLEVNFRSDAPLLEALNESLAGASFGPGIDYQAVRAAPDRGASRLANLPPVEFIGLGDMRLQDVAVRKVWELLDRGRLDGPADDRQRPIRPRDICMLVRANATGKAIEADLARLGIPAVSTGTASVMQGRMADDLRVLLEAMGRPGSGGRVRRAAATVLFGHPLTEVGRLDEDLERAVQERIAALHGVLQARGSAALGAAIMDDVDLAGRLAAGPDGERHVVDLSHLVELLHNATRGRACHARVLLEHLAELATRDEKSDLVSRRVESDEDAVRIMSVHVAKGLEFPCVVVVDHWKGWTKCRGPAVFYAGTERRLDVAHAVDGAPSSTAARAVIEADNDELRRLLYVALTRPRHHLCVIRRTDGDDAVMQSVVSRPPPARAAADLPRPAGRWQPGPDARTGMKPAVAPPPASVEQTYRRTSFSGITATATRRAGGHHAPPGRGHDEGPVADGERGDPPASAGPPGLERFPMPDLPAGMAFGSAVHEIFERLAGDPAADATSRVAAAGRVVDEVATSHILRRHREPLVAMVVATLETPFGGPAGFPFRDRRFADFGPADRLAELEFEMGLAGLAAGVRASDMGCVLADYLPAGDVLGDYARLLAGPTFEIPLAGLINGSIDAVLRLPGRPIDDPSIVIAD
ncbi:MAG: hypothetical protein FJ284_09920, partial [Planctomycetes bacterium]|nr:hypothetical protein [Planctomycetota bacterium]